MLRSSLRTASALATVAVCAATASSAGAFAKGTATIRRHSPAAAALSADLSPGALFLQRYAATNMASDQAVTESQAIDIATRLNVIVATKRTFAPYAAAMRAVNPNLRLLAYQNGAFAQSNQLTAYPDSWYARGAGGDKVRSRGFGNYLMNIGNPAWRQSAAQECATNLAKSGYDGCYLDMLGTAPLSLSYVNAVPINTATGAVWTPGDYLAATSAIAAEVKLQNPAVIVAGNGLGSGTRYYNEAGGSPVPLLLALDAAHAEVWLRTPHQSLTKFKSESAWLRDVSMIADAGVRGRVVLATTKIWTPGSSTQIDAWHRYTVASFLLGTNGRSYLNFLPSQTMAGITSDNAYDRPDVGTPLGPFAKSGGVYQRAFTKGLALVNPATTAVTVQLPAPMATLDGSVVSTLSMAANTGEVLTALP